MMEPPTEDLHHHFPPPEDGVYIHGLFLEGAKWDHENKWIDEADPGEMVVSLPMVWFKPVTDYVHPEDCYACPLYKTSVRAGTLSTTGQSTNFVLHMSLRVKPETKPAHWILEGVSCLCMTNN